MDEKDPDFAHIVLTRVQTSAVPNRNPRAGPLDVDMGELGGLVGSKGLDGREELGELGQLGGGVVPGTRTCVFEHVLSGSHAVSLRQETHTGSDPSNQQNSLSCPYKQLTSLEHVGSVGGDV